MDGHRMLNAPSEQEARLPASGQLLFVSFFLLVLVIVAALWGERQASLYARDAFETQRRELATVRLLSLLQDAETGQRGYLLTQDRVFLQPYESAIALLAQQRESLASAILDDEAGRRHVQRLEILIDERLKYIREALDLLEDGKRDEALRLIGAGEGKARMDQIRAIISEINLARDKLLETNQERLEDTGAWVRVVEVLGLFVLILTTGTIVRQSRLALIAQNQIRESQTQAILAATAANRAKSAFLATMSHELRTPMTAVLGMCDLLSASKLGPEEREITQLISRNAKSLLHLLDDILDFSKIEAGRLTYEKVDFELSAVLEEVKSLFEPLASQKGLILEVSKNPGPRDVFVGDPKRLRQVLVNLIGNAIKFTNKGRITVHVRQTATDEGNTLLEIEVEDSGEGIADDAKARLFREFEQEDASTSRRRGGTGLGLSISKAIVEALGGRIGVTSEKGHGSRFFFSLPVIEGNPERVKARAPSGKDEAFLLLAGRKLQILLAEDAPATQFLVQRMFALWGHDVTVAGNGREAVEKANHRKWDVILMDMQMPEMDGPEATRRIRAGGGLSSNTPIIALTADAVLEHRQIYLESGCNAVATKPIDWSALAHLIAGYHGLVDNIEIKPLTESPVKSWADVPLLDLPLLTELDTSLGTEVLKGLVEAAITSAFGSLRELQSVLPGGGAEVAARLAHRIAGVVGQIGAARAAAVARQLEEGYRMGRSELALLEAFVSCIHESEEALMQFVSRLSAEKPGARIR